MWRRFAGTKRSGLSQLDNGEIDFHVDVEGLSEIVWWVLGYGSQAKVLEPLELQQMVLEHIEGMLQQYGMRQQTREN